jgi:hypothetical protein
MKRVRLRRFSAAALCSAAVGVCYLETPAPGRAMAQRRNAATLVEIAAMQPGDYVVRAIVGVDGKEAGRAVRP